MIKNIHFKRFLRIVACVLIIVSVVSGAGLFCNHPNIESENTINSFYNEKDSLDYVIIGASSSLNNVSPSVIWNEKQISGNNFSINGTLSTIYPSILKEAVSRQKDALLIIDVDAFSYDSESPEDYGSTASWIDLMPKNKNWLETIKECDSENTVEHLFPILKYHCYTTKAYTFLSQTKKSLTDNSPDILKGWSFYSDINIPRQNIDSLKTFDSNAVSAGNLDDELKTNLFKTLDFCKDNNLNVLFVDYPKAYFDENKKQTVAGIEQNLLACENIINRYGYEVLNYNKLNNPANLTRDDFADCYHLKKNGAVKFSTFLANYLADNYTFKPHTADYTDRWNKTTKEAYETYKL